MFVGHFAVALGAKRAVPAASLGTLIIAAQLADLIWPVLVLAGIETFTIVPGITAVTPLDFTSYPYSHSLVMLAVWGALLAVMIGPRLQRAKGPRGLMTLAVIAAVVISHWVLDVVSHRPDMPLTPFDQTKLGLGLWNSRPATIVVELVMLVAGVGLYLSTTRPKNRTGMLALAGFITFLLVINVGNMYGPPPSSVDAVAYSALLMWLFVAWGYWIDRHREARA